MAEPESLNELEFGFLTWTHPQLNQVAIQSDNLRKHCPLDNFQLRFVRKAKKISSTSNAGLLETLPLEIIQIIFSLLDLQSLTDLRSISWLARTLVDSVPSYKAIIQHCPDVIRALLSTHMAVYFTAGDSLRALCSKICEGCGAIGPFLDLFTSHRYCLGCVISSNDLLCMTVTSAKRDYRLNPKTIRTLPTLLSLPGEYSETGKEYRRRVSLVRRNSAFTAGYALRSAESSSPRRRPEVFYTQLSNPFFDTANPCLSPQRIDTYRKNPYRFMPLLRIPFLDRRTRNLDWGVSCQACRLRPHDIGHGYYYYDPTYTTEGYPEHFRKCRLSQKAREMLPEFTRYVGEDRNLSENTFVDFLAYYDGEDPSIWAFVF